MQEFELKKLLETADMCLDEASSMDKKIPRKNDKGEDVPEVCPKCGAKVGVFLRGEPVFLCTNKECEKYFGTVPFGEDASEMLMEHGKMSEKDMEEKEKYIPHNDPGTKVHMSTKSEKKNRPDDSINEKRDDNNPDYDTLEKHD